MKLIFAWYDLWVGVFIDRPNHRVYIFPIPCVGIRVQWRKVEYTFAGPRPSLFDGPWADHIPEADDYDRHFQ